MVDRSIFSSLRAVAFAGVVLPALLVVTSPASAQTFEEFQATATDLRPEFTNPRVLGMGGAFTGGGNGLGALYHNPAGVLTAGVYEFDIGFQRTFGTEGNAFGVGIADAKTNPSIAAAFAYSFAFGRDPALQRAFDAAGDSLEDANSRFRDHDIRGALAFPIVPQRVSIGAGLHYVHASRGSYSQDVSREVTIELTDENGDPTGETQVQTEITSDDFVIRHSGLTLDAGIFALLSEEISFGFAARNLLKIDDWNQNRRLEAGIGGHFEALHVEAGWFAEQSDEGKFESGANVGIEYSVVSAPLRLGYRYDGATGSHFLASGAGYRSEKVGVDIGFEQNMSNRPERRLSVGMSVYF